MSVISQDDWDRLVRFAGGECSGAEAADMARWVEESAERQEALAFVRDVGVAAEVGRPQWDTDASWERLTVRRHARAYRPAPLQPTLEAARRSRRRTWWVAAAAAIVLTVSLSGVWWLGRGPAASGSGTAGQVAGVPRERLTRPGERATFRLPDGSLVMLAPSSRLRYPAALGATSGLRELYLEGQALFEVLHDERRPFLVHTAHGLTKDLGTRFTVREYSADTAVLVVVAEGSVELRAARYTDAGAGALLRPGQLGWLTRTGETVVRSGINLDQHLAWTQGRLVFDDTPLRDALVELGRWYDVKFVLADPVLGARPLTATFAGEALSETLRLLNFTLGTDYERHGRTVTLRPRR